MSMRTKTGVATSTAMDKTVVVTVHTYKRHPKYMKRYRTTKKFYAHDEENRVRAGNVVVIQETRPLSKLKRWKVIDVQEGTYTMDSPLDGEAVVEQELATDISVDKNTQE